jgi:UPF0755 protein
MRRTRLRFYSGALWGLILLSAIACAFLLSNRAAQIWAPGNAAETRFQLEKGETVRGVFDEIESTGRPASRISLSAYARVAAIDRKVKAGRYRIPGDWSAAQILEQAALGGNDPLRVTLPPGLALPEVARRLEDAGWVESATAWLALASGTEVHAVLRRESYEGLVAPETYYFDSKEPPDRVLETLHSEWKRSIETETQTSDLDRALANGLTLYDTITLASLIEKEAAKEVERATVSSVFHNRIRKGWPLGSAATLRYAVGDWTGSDRNLPVNLKSPYNTSRKPGLPPTPICLPSVESLRAALHPPETEYFFFVADGDGGLIFNRTHDEHRASVRDYRNKTENGN